VHETELSEADSLACPLGLGTGLRVLTPGYSEGRMQTSMLIVTLGFLSFLSSARAEEPLVQHLRGGETKEIYWGINLRGVVYLSIRGRDGVGCAHMFWRPIPIFGRTIPLNDVCGNIRTEIPGASRWAIGGELWARANHGDIAIVLSSIERVAYDFPPVDIP
jgi:hypothetical protein